MRFIYFAYAPYKNRMNWVVEHLQKRIKMKQNKNQRQKLWSICILSVLFVELRVFKNIHTKTICRWQTVISMVVVVVLLLFISFFLAYFGLMNSWQWQKPRPVRILVHGASAHILCNAFWSSSLIAWNKQDIHFI